MGRYALLVAASDYEDPYFAQLRSPAQDVRALAEVLQDPAIGGFDVTVLENVPDHRIRRALEDLAADRQSDDVVLVYFSCHGLQDIHGRLHFATTMTRSVRPASTAVSAAFVSEQLEHTIAGGRLLMLDCCYSGAFARGFAKSSPRPLDGELNGSRGYVCLTACNEYELAYEGDHVVLDQPRPSHFTEMIIEGLRTGAADLDRDGWVETGELHKYVFDTVRGAGRQTPSYFATGLQREIRVARAAGQPGPPIPVAAAATTSSRTPRFFSPRFPPFHFARENRTTPTALAEAMAARPAAAADLFAHDDERNALYGWIDHDVADRDLERGILRKTPADRGAAEAAAAVFIATFAPHLQAAFRGWHANVAGLIAAAAAAIDGHPEAARMVADLYRHNLLRTLAHHDCSDHGHACGSGNACHVLRDAATRWDGVVPAAHAAADEVPAPVRPTEEVVVAQLLLMILDPASRSLPPQRDMPAWWLRLVLHARVTADGSDARLGPLAVAALTRQAAAAERDSARQALLAGARHQSDQATTQGATQSAQHDRRRRRTVRRHRMLATATTLGAVGLVGGFTVRSWKSPDHPPAIYLVDGTYLAIAALTGLLLVAPATIMLAAGRQFWRRRWLDGASGTAVAILLVGVVAASLPLVRGLFDDRAHQRITTYAKANGLVLDDQDRPIPSDCGTETKEGGTTVSLIWTNQTADGCRVADIYINGLRTGRLQLPKGSRRNVGDRWWIAEYETTNTAVVIPLWRPTLRTWQVIGLSAQTPQLPFWSVNPPPNLAGTEQLKVIAWHGVLYFEARSGTYTIDMYSGAQRGTRHCPPGSRFGGLGPIAGDAVSIFCGNTVVTVSQ